MGCAMKKIVVPSGNVKIDPQAHPRGRWRSGMTAALAAADAGPMVVIVNQPLDGFARNLLERVPFNGPYAEPPATGVEEMAAESAPIRASGCISSSMRP